MDGPERLQKKPAPEAKVLITREDPPASRKTRTLDELLLEKEQLSQERDSSARVSDESDDEEETCLFLHEPGKAIIDTGCGCVIGAVTLEAHQSVMGDRAKEITWQHVIGFLLRKQDQRSQHGCH